MTESQSTQWLISRPDISAEYALEVAANEFGVAGSAQELGSQQDKNFLITSTEDPKAIVLKFFNPQTSPEVIDLQAFVASTLHEAGLNTPAIFPTKLQALGVDVGQSSGDATVHARAYDFIEGGSLETHTQITGVTAERLGELAGATVDALKFVTHDAADRALQWDLRNTKEVVDALIHHLPQGKREICSEAVITADEALQKVIDDLPTQVIHGDLTCDNVIQDELRRLWIIDLGDVAISWRVAEFAITAADIFGRTGDISHVFRALKGFANHTSLNESELKAIWPLMILRGAALAVSGWSQLSIDPDNAYASERLEHEWQVLERTLAIDADHAHALLRLAAGLSHREGVDYSEITPNFGDHTVLDLSVTSELLDRGAWLDSNAEAKLVAATTSTYTVARFGEARMTRTSADVTVDAFTRARGIEIWAPVGTEILAPFSGSLLTEGGLAQITDHGLTLTIEGVDPVSHQTVGARNVAVPGKLLGTTKTDSFFVSLQFAGAQNPERFAKYNAEYMSASTLDPSPILGLEAAPDVDLIRVREQVRRDLAMGGASERYYDDPPQIERGWQSLLVETRGRAYLDMVNNVTAIGHANPVLADRVSRQLNLLNTNSRFLYSAYADFTEKLLAHSPHPSLDTVIPVNSGSEALDLSIRLAQVATGRKTVVAAREGYHGWTMASDAVSTSAFDNPNALDSRPDWVEIVDAPNSYRGIHQGEDAGPKYAADVADKFNSLLAAGRAPAAFICEPVLGNAGGVVPPAGYLEGVYAAIRSHGGLAIADEVQVGYGRMGESFWACEMFDVVPDIIATAKAAGNAYPIGAVITRREIAEALQLEGMFFSSAGGAPASAIAGSAVLDEINSRGLQEHAREVGEAMIHKLEALAQKHPMIGKVHGKGLYLGIELVRDRVTKEPAVAETARVCERLLELGVIMQATSERQNVLKVKPPMVITHAEVDMFLSALDRALEELS